MKYILEYKNYTNLISENIKDILVDLTDEGFEVKVTFYENTKGSIIKTSDNKYFFCSFKVQIYNPLLNNESEMKAKRNRLLQNCIPQLKMFMEQEGYPLSHINNGYKLIEIIYFGKNTIILQNITRGDRNKLEI